MTKHLDLYNRLQERDEHGKSFVEGKRFTLIEACTNNFHTDQLPKIPAGSVIQCEFACDSGMYAVADVSGKLHKVLIPITDFHLIDFGDL